MTQMVLLKKFRAFLKITSQHPDYTNKLIKGLEDDDKTEVGVCFGLSLCYGVMEILGKRKWWEEALVSFTTWDEKAETLTIEKRALFERIIHYVLYAQVHIEGLEHLWPNMINQANQIKVPTEPNQNPSFQFIDEHDQVQTIKQYTTVVGHFNRTQLLALLKPSAIKGNVCLVNTEWHSVNVIYTGQKWILYDSNFSHDNPNQLSLEFNNVGNMIDKLLQIQGSELQIHLSSFSPDKEMLPVEQYDSWLNENPLPLMENGGLSLMVRANHKIIMEILNKHSDSKLLQSIITEIIKTLSSKISGSKDNMIDFLINAYSSETPGTPYDLFLMLAQAEEFKPHQLRQLSKSITESTHFPEIASQLCWLYTYYPSTNENGRIIALLMQEIIITDYLEEMNSNTLKQSSQSVVLMLKTMIKEKMTHFKVTYQSTDAPKNEYLKKIDELIVAFDKASTLHDVLSAIQLIDAEIKNQYDEKKRPVLFGKERKAEEIANIINENPKTHHYSRLLCLALNEITTIIPYASKEWAVTVLLASITIPSDSKIYQHYQASSSTHTDPNANQPPN